MTLVSLALGHSILATLKKVHDPTKLGVRTEGPYTIERVHINGNLTILLREGITERINIRIVDHSTCPCEDNS